MSDLQKAFPSNHFKAQLSLTNSALVYEPKCGGKGAGVQGLSQLVQLCTCSPIKLWISNSIFDLSLGNNRKRKLK